VDKRVEALGSKFLELPGRIYLAGLALENIGSFARSSLNFSFV
jgi:hypothetical protein